jgi:ParB family chromosome partitioning protein
MAKITKSTPNSALREIPWNKLALSPKNVRRIAAVAEDPEFTEDIANRGVLLSLLVRPQLDEAGSETGLFEVTAGGRRYAAVGRLVEAGRLPADTPLPCRIKAEGIAEEDSFAENIQRAPLHPVDQYRAFSALSQNGLSEEDIAARFFVTVAVVRQRLRLAAVSPAILEAFVRDEMRLDHVMAFTVNPDQQRQDQVWTAISKNTHGREPYQIRRMLTEGAVMASDKRALFVGVEAYAEAGGEIYRDLFISDGGGYLQDVALLDRLVAERLEAQAELIKQEGWLWVDAALEQPYGHTFGLRRIDGSPIDLTDDEKDELDELTTKYDALTAEYEGADEYPDDIDQQFADLEARIEALQNRPIAFDPAEIARGGVFLSVSPQGALRIERGYVRPEDEPSVEDEPNEGQAGEPDGVAAATSSSDSISSDAEPAPVNGEDEDDGLKPLSDRLLGDLTAFRTVALRDRLATHPRVAFTLLLHTLCCDQFYRRSDGHCLEIRISSASLYGHSGLSDFSSSTAVNDRNTWWRERMPADTAALWDFLEELEDADRLSLLAHCLSYGINALYEKAERYSAGPSQHTIDSRLRNADFLAQVTDLDMHAIGWRPTTQNYFNDVSKAHILKAVTEAKGHDAARRISPMKKADMAAEAERLLADTAWLPDALRTPKPQDEVEDAVGSNNPGQAASDMADNGSAADPDLAAAE